MPTQNANVHKGSKLPRSQIAAPIRVSTSPGNRRMGAAKGESWPSFGGCAKRLVDAKECSLDATRVAIWSNIWKLMMGIERIKGIWALPRYVEPDNSDGGNKGHFRVHEYPTHPNQMISCPKSCTHL